MVGVDWAARRTAMPVRRRRAAGVGGPRLTSARSYSAGSVSQTPRAVAARRALLGFVATVAVAGLLVWAADAFGLRSGTFAFLAVWLTMSWQALVRVPVRLPRPYYRLRPWELSGPGVPADGSRTHPTRHAPRTVRAAQPHAAAADSPHRSGPPRSGATDAGRRNSPCAAVRADERVGAPRGNPGLVGHRRLDVASSTVSSTAIPFSCSATTEPAWGCVPRVLRAPPRIEQERCVPSVLLDGCRSSRCVRP